MRIYKAENYQEMSLEAAKVLAEQVVRNPKSVLGLATGSTPIGIYQQLIAWHQEGLVDFSNARSFNLDEYVGLKPDHPCSYRYFMNEQLFDHINMKDTRVPSGIADDMEKEARDYDRAIERAGGIDLQLLGLGQNGHIGFNEPADEFSYGTQVVDLTESTIKANRRFFEKEEDVPRKTISLGIGGIMKAGQVVLCAFGANKAQAVRDMVYGPLSPRCPASILQLHKDAVILLDEEAAALL